MKPHFRYTFSVATAVALAVHGAAARAAGEITDEPLETVTIVARVARPIAATDASVSVMESAHIEARLAQDLRDLARYEPALSIRGDATRFGDDAVSIRGIGGNRVLMVADGVPRPGAFAIGNFANAGRSISDLDFVRRIELLKGPASATYGSSAIGGVIAVETLEAADLLADDAARAARARLQYGSDDHGLQGSLVGVGRNDRIEWLAGALRRDAGESQNEWRALDANPRDFEETSWLAKLALRRPGVEVREPLQIQAGGNERHTLTRVDSVLLQPGRFANTTAMHGDDRARDYTVSVGQTLLDFGPAAQLHWLVFHRQLEVDQRTFEERRAAPPRTPALQLDRRFTYDVRFTGARLLGARDTRRGNWSHRWSFGLELSRQRIEELRDGLQTTVATGATTATILGEAFPLRDFPNSKVVEAGAFAFDEMQLDGSRWTLSPALRIDDYRLSARADAIYAADNPTQAPVDVRETSVSPRLGLTYRLRDGVTAFGQYSHGFRSPPFEDVNIGLDLPQFLTRAMPNPDLRPEKSDHIEAGLRVASPRLAGTASLYLARYRDFIESKVALGRDPVSGYSLFQSQNRARARIVGGEVALRFPLGGGAESGDASWHASVTAAWARGDDTAAHRPLNSVDPPRGSLGLEYAGARDDWQVSAWLNYAAAQARIDETAGPLARAGGHATFDVLAGWTIRDGLHVRAALFNVLDRRYVEWADVRGRAATDPSLDLYTRPGRSASLSLTLQLD